MLPSLSNQSRETSVLRRLLGSSGLTSDSLGKNLSTERQKAQKAVLDSMLDPCSVEGMSAMAVQEPHRSACFANLQKLRTELANKPELPVSSGGVQNTCRIITVKEMKQTEEQERNHDEAPRQENDGRPLKSLHWNALGTSATAYTKKHHCEGNSWNCEKCRRVMEIRKATERFEAKRAAKQIIQESENTKKALAEAKSEVEENEQKIKREERFCRFAPPNARTVVQRSKTTTMGYANFLPIAGNSKWAQPVLTEMPQGVFIGRPIDYTKHIAPSDSDWEIKLERSESNIPSCVSDLRFENEYMDDEPDFESEKIASGKIVRKSQTSVVFIPPNCCERNYFVPRPIQPRIRIIDMSWGENDGIFHESRGLTSLRKLMPGKTQVTEVLEVKITGNAEKWTDDLKSPQELDEKDSDKLECESEEVLTC